MKLSYAITACNEVEETIRLVSQLLNYKEENSEIVVLLDTPKAPTELVEYLELQGNADKITLIESEFNNDFAQWKNLLNSECKGEWIFQLDADEYLENDLIHNLEDILDNNLDKDLILVPRINTVEGLTQTHIQKWGWNVNEKGWVNFQMHKPVSIKIQIKLDGAVKYMKGLMDLNHIPIFHLKKYIVLSILKQLKDKKDKIIITILYNGICLLSHLCN